MGINLGAVLGGAFVAVTFFLSCGLPIWVSLRRNARRRNISKTERLVEVPTRPQTLRQPPHLTSQPGPSAPMPTPVPGLSRPVTQPPRSTSNETWARAFETMAHAMRQGNQNTQEISSQGLHYPPQLPPPGPSSSHLSHPPMPSSHPPPASSHISLPVPTAVAPPPSNQASNAEVAALRSEIEQLRREQQQMQIDSGPAEPPPAYDEGHYIP